MTSATAVTTSVTAAIVTMIAIAVTVATTSAATRTLWRLCAPTVRRQSASITSLTLQSLSALLVERTSLNNKLRSTTEKQKERIFPFLFIIPTQSDFITQ